MSQYKLARLSFLLALILVGIGVIASYFSISHADKVIYAGIGAFALTAKAVFSILVSRTKPPANRQVNQGSSN